MTMSVWLPEPADAVPLLRRVLNGEQPEGRNVDRETVEAEVLYSDQTWHRVTVLASAPSSPRPGCLGPLGGRAPGLEDLQSSADAAVPGAAARMWLGRVKWSSAKGGEFRAGGRRQVQPRPARCWPRTAV